MGRRQTDKEAGGLSLLTLFLMGVISCCMVYSYLSASSFHSESETVETTPLSVSNDASEDAVETCCRGIEHLELWGKAVNWGYNFRLNSSEDCCLACKKMCPNDQPCLCDSWVFCGDRHACGARFGECWLKKQTNSLEPDRRDSNDNVMWTSGFIFAKGEDIVALETEFGVLRIQLFPNCAPYSVSYILDLLQSHVPLGCHFYRAESRGGFWDSRGNHLQNAPYGPPFALIQGTLEAHGKEFKPVGLEFSPSIRRGSVAWVGSGPDFFISLANHPEWNKAYTVFGSVLPQDMVVAETISMLPTEPDTWSNITVSVLDKPVGLQFRRIDGDTSS